MSSNAHSMGGDEAMALFAAVRPPRRDCGGGRGVGHATFVFQSNVEAISSAAQGISESMAAIVACFR